MVSWHDPVSCVLRNSALYPKKRLGSHMYQCWVLAAKPPFRWHAVDFSDIIVMLQEHESVIIELSAMRKVVEKEVYMISHTDGHKINIKYIVALVPAMQLNRENDL